MDIKESPRLVQLRSAWSKAIDSTLEAVKEDQNAEDGSAIKNCFGPLEEKHGQSFQEEISSSLNQFKTALERKFEDYVRTKDLNSELLAIDTACDIDPLSTALKEAKFEQINNYKHANALLESNIRQLRDQHKSNVTEMNFLIDSLREFEQRISHAKSLYIVDTSLDTTGMMRE